LYPWFVVKVELFWRGKEKAILPKVEGDKNTPGLWLKQGLTALILVGPGIKGSRLNLLRSDYHKSGSQGLIKNKLVEVEGIIVERAIRGIKSIWSKYQRRVSWKTRLCWFREGIGNPDRRGRGLIATRRQGCPTPGLHCCFQVSISPHTHN
jgi:hypothetical protein